VLPAASLASHYLRSARPLLLLRLAVSLLRQAAEIELLRLAFWLLLLRLAVSLLGQAAEIELPRLAFWLLGQVAKIVLLRSSY